MVKPKITNENYEQKVANATIIAKPMASKRLLIKCFKLLRKARRFRQSSILVGIRDVQRAVRYEVPGIVLIAGDVRPIEVVCHLPALCEQTNTPYVYVPSKDDLGTAVKIKSSCVAVMIQYNTAYERRYNKVYKKLKYLPL